MNARRVAVFLAYILAALLSLALAKEYTSDKRVHQGTSSFKTMMRYGRAAGGSNNVKTLSVYPRADAFFLGPRYGKRSSWSPNTSLVYPVSAPLCGVDEDLSCTYTGISDFYRCTQRKDDSNEDFSASN